MMDLLPLQALSTTQIVANIVSTIINSILAKHHSGDKITALRATIAAKITSAAASEIDPIFPASNDRQIMTIYRYWEINKARHLQLAQQIQTLAREYFPPLLVAFAQEHPEMNTKIRELKAIFSNMEIPIPRELLTMVEKAQQMLHPTIQSPSTTEGGRGGAIAAAEPISIIILKKINALHSNILDGAFENIGKNLRKLNGLLALNPESAVILSSQRATLYAALKAHYSETELSQYPHIFPQQAPVAVRRRQPFFRREKTPEKSEQLIRYLTLLTGTENTEAIRAEIKALRAELEPILKDVESFAKVFKEARPSPSLKGTAWLTNVQKAWKLLQTLQRSRQSLLGKRKSEKPEGLAAAQAAAHEALIQVTAASLGSQLAHLETLMRRTDPSTLFKLHRAIVEIQTSIPPELTAELSEHPIHAALENAKKQLCDQRQEDIILLLVTLQSKKSSKTPLDSKEVLNLRTLLDLKIDDEKFPVAESLATQAQEVLSTVEATAAPGGRKFSFPFTTSTGSGPKKKI
jgi:hypothetical protein